MALTSRLSAIPADLWRAGLLFAVLGYLGTGGMITLTLPYASDVYDASDAELGTGLAVVRVGVLLALALGVLLDTHGRARFLVHGMVAYVVIGSAIGLAPTFWVYIALFVLVRMFRTALAVALTVLVVEQTAAERRALVLAFLTFAVGAGIVGALAVVPLAAAGRWGFAAAYGLLILFLPLVVRWARALPESPRFAAHLGEPRGLRELWRGQLRQRMVVLGSITLLSAAFFAPVTDFFTRYLDRDRGFSPTEIVIFLVATGALAVPALFAGGHLGDRVGRKRVGVPLLALCGLCFVGFYLVDGWALWVLATFGQAMAAAGFAAMAPYGAEMFPTRVRGAANASLAVITVVGSAIGLLTVGLLSDPLGLGEAVAVLAVAPLASLVITVFGLPETAGLELEQTSGDQPGPTGLL
jgi:MFS family permease